MNLGLLEAAQMIYKSLIKQLEGHYKESHGTVVYNPFNHSWRYRCKHPEVLQVCSLINPLTQIDKRDIQRNIFIISPRKLILWVLIRSASVRHL